MIADKNRNLNRGFRKLEIWNLAIELYRTEVVALKANNQISWKVKAQIEDSTLSISSNIAEGYSRISIRETLRFYEFALSSAAENFSQLTALCSAGQIDEKYFSDFDSLIYELENKLLKMNKSLISQIKLGEEWRTDY